METLYEKIVALCNERGIKGGKMCTDIGMSKGILTDLKMGRQTSVSISNAKKIAAYFGISVDYLLGDETRKKNAPTESGERAITMDELKVALFRGREDVTDDMVQEVLGFADFIAQREDQKKKE